VTLRVDGSLEVDGRARRARSVRRIRFDRLAGAVRVDGVQVEDPRQARVEAARYRLTFPGVPGRARLFLRVEASIDHAPGVDVPGAPAALWDHRRPYLEIRHMEKLLR
jgi:hypothetical protein